MSRKRNKRLPYSGKQWDEFYNEFRDKNDRAVAIVGATMLDESLGMLLDSISMYDDHSSITPANFKDKISEAYKIDLITDEQRHDLDIIRAIRNSFAHELDKSLFDHVDIAEQCKALKIPNRFTISNNPRDRFITAVAVLMYSFSIARSRNQVEKHEAQCDEE